MKPHPRGAGAERQALRHLQAAGLILVVANYHTRFGEIDLIMSDSDCLVFVEVRHRSDSGFGSALESIGPTKIKRLRTSAECFLTDRRHAACVKSTQSRRFDVVAMDGVAHSPRLNWIKDAF